MKKRPDAWMALYPADYLRDTMGLTTEQHGAYLLLIMACWTAGGQLPDEDEELSSIAKMTLPAWRKMRKRIARFFIIVDGFWSHKRVTEEHEKAKTLSALRQEVGRLGGRPRKNQTETKPKPKGKPKANLTKTPSPSPSELEPYGSELRGRGTAERAEGSPVPRWFSEFVDEATAAKGADWVASWMGSAQWQEVPERAVICPLGVQTRTLKAEFRKLLKEKGIAVKTAVTASAA